MVTTLPTIYDSLESEKYTSERTKLYMYTVLSELIPHVMSQAIVKIRAATQDDYKFQLRHQNEAIVVDIVFTEKLASMLNCIPFYPRHNTCQHFDGVKLFKSGNSDLIGCGPACFNLVSGGGSEVPHTPLLLHVPRFQTTIIQDVNTFAYMADDGYRSEKDVIEPNVSTIGTGFDILSNEFIMDRDKYVAQKFGFNDYYCSHFGQQLNTETQYCETTAANDIVGFFIGDYLYRSIGKGWNYLIKGNSGIWQVNKPNLDPINVNALPLYTRDIEAWKNEIRPGFFILNWNVTLSDLGLVGDKHNWIWTNESNVYGELIEPSDSLSEKPSYFKLNLVPREFMTDDTNFRLREEVYRHISIVDGGANVDMPISEDLNDFLGFGDAAIIGLSFATDYTIEVLRKKIIDITRRVVISIVEKSELFISKMGVRFFNATMRTTITQVTRIFLRTLVSQALIKIATIASTGLLVLEVAMIASIIADLLLNYFDWFKLNVYFPKDFLNNLSLASLKENLKNYNSKNPEFSLEQLYARYTSIADSENMRVAIREGLENAAARNKVNENNHPNPNILFTGAYQPFELFTLITVSKYYQNSDYNSLGQEYRWNDDNLVNNPLESVEKIRINEEMFQDELENLLRNYHFNNGLSRANTWSYIGGAITLPLIGLNFILNLNVLNIFIILFMFIIIVVSNYFLFYDVNSTEFEIRNLQYLFIKNI